MYDRSVTNSFPVAKNGDVFNNICFGANFPLSANTIGSFKKPELLCLTFRALEAVVCHRVLSVAAPCVQLHCDFVAGDWVW